MDIEVIRAKIAQGRYVIASCLILGMAAKRPLHVVFGRLDADEILVITAYDPDPEQWENNWRTRRSR